MDQMMMTEEGRCELSEYSPDNNANTNSTVKDMLLGCACVNMKRRPGPVDVGSTACVALIRGNQIIAGNAGDCRCVVGTKVFEMVFLLVHEEEEVKSLICPPRKRSVKSLICPEGGLGSRSWKKGTLHLCS